MMNTEESFVSFDKQEFHGFSKTTNFDCSYAFLVKDGSLKQNNLNTNTCQMLSSNLSKLNSHEDGQHIISSQTDTINSWSDGKSFQLNADAFNVLQRPPVLINVNSEETSPVRKKLVYAPISPVQQTFTPMKNLNISTEIKVFEVVKKYDEVYNKYSKNRGKWDIQPSIDKTDQLLTKYSSNILYYNDNSDKEEEKDVTVDSVIKSDQTPKSSSKTDSSNNDFTPAKFNDDSTGTSKIIPVKISPPFLSMENSNNAMDNSIKIMEKLNLKSEVQDFSGPLSFENKIPKIKNKGKQKFFDNIKMVENNKMSNMVENNKISNTQSKSDSSQYAPSSPNLFSDDNSDDNMEIDDELGASKLSKDDEKDKLIQNDLELLRRLQKTLSGVLPPPSLTITQLDLGQILDLYKTNLSNESINQNSLLSTPHKRTLTDSILDNQISSTPPSLKSWVSLPAGFNTIPLEQIDTHTQTLKEEFTPSIIKKSPDKKSLLVSCTFEEVMNAKWPEVMNCRYHGIHYNRCLASEEFELLCLKFCERYIGAETQTSCTLSNRPHAKKNTMTRLTQSPGRRLSHLARRRQTFSSANLQAGCTLENKIKKPIASARQIMLSSKNDNVNRRRYKPLPARKTILGRRTPGKKTPGKKTPGRKTPGKKTPCRKTPNGKTPRKKVLGKSTPNTSARKRNICRRIVLDEVDTSSNSSKPTLETSKRALFQSPPRTLETFDIDHSSTSSSRFDNGFLPRRALFHSPEKDSTSIIDNEINMKMKSFDSRKRKFSEVADDTSDCSSKSKFPRSLSFNSSSIGGKIITRRSSENIVGTANKTSTSELSDIHRKKLLWAVAEALRSQNIGMSHPQFKTHAAVLARLTRKLILEEKEKTGSTSEKMLKLAKLHVFSVIKGKTVEEIIIEEHIRKAKASNSKITGYVPLSEYEQNKISVLSQRLTKPIKDTKFCVNEPNNHNNLNSSMQNSCLTSMDCSNSPPKSVLQDKSLNLENNILDSKIKACRQICFDDCPKR